VIFVFNESLTTQNLDPELNSINIWEESTVSEEVDPGVSLLSAAETGIIPVERQLVGPSLLEKHCAACHAEQALELNRKSRSEWEITLEKMKNFGLELSQEEQDILLDYLETR